MGKDGRTESGRRHGSAPRVECIVPILRVENLAASVRYYRDILGFTLDWGDAEGADMVSVSRNGQAIMLCQGAQGQPGTWIWIGVEDIAPLYGPPAQGCSVPAAADAATLGLRDAGRRSRRARAAVRVRAGDMT
jgi:catechol 2,3-dioxygenase-like lactoylglutathione lyase family enzyme